MSETGLFDFEDTFPTHKTDRRMSPNPRQQAPKNLRSIHHEILRLLILGWKQVDIARHLCVTPISVSNCLASPKGQAVIMMMQQRRMERTVDIAEDMRQFAPTAFNVVKELVEDENVQPSVRLRGADLALGLAGYVKPQRIQSQSVHTHLTLDEIEQLKAQARERANASGIIASSEANEILENQGIRPIGSQGESSSDDCVDVGLVERVDTKC